MGNFQESYRYRVTFSGDGHGRDSFFLLVNQRNYSKGRVQLRLQNDGSLVLNTVNLPTDYANEPYL
ncbi:hypothetical protein L484_018403 [Morus notabilis]|uniref:Uncharacterized protein n=1 Tax=Morus notabilis TaxID=981085 RepID=W9QK68_9ROSA|nr:hypothetical protein L484_018403 [Morus notabilis]